MILNNWVKLGIGGVFLLAATATVVLAGQGGSIDSGGSDMHAADYGAAWFLGSDPVHYCIETAPQFGRTAEDVDVEFRNVLRKWASYIRDRGVDQELQGDPRIQLNLNFVRVAQCDASVELTIYGGVGNQRIQDALKGFENPVAVAIRESYDVFTGRAKGFIWLRLPFAEHLRSSPYFYGLDWTKPHTLEGALLHEFGHVLGNGHVRKTIMEEDLASALIWNDLLGSIPDESRRNQYVQARKRQLSQIDWGRSLAMHMDGSTAVYLGDMGPVPSPADVAVFTKFVGRAPQGKVKVQAQGAACPEGQNAPVCAQLTFTDEIGPGSIFVKIILSSVRETPSDERAFFRYRKERNPNWYNGEQVLSMKSVVGSSTMLATGTDASGKSALFQFAVNMDRSPLSIQVVGENDQMEWILFTREVRTRI
ncbi:MAG: hypothetical protein NDJ89_09660 [Oligoflexia bacterium]|nr:hypothetical protein [Oligoflexia bacterium]